MILHDGMLVKRKDTGAKGVAHQISGNMWKVKYHDGTHTYTTQSAFKKHFVIPELEINFEDEQEESMTYDEYLNQSDDVVTKHLEKEAHKTASDLIDNQKHYTNNGIQPIQIMKANMTKEKYRGFLEGNILKYPLRYEDKNGLEDLKKAKTYLTWLIEDIEERGL
nr:MAG TPA: nucelotide kinase [Caudoviricetes sp.]